MPSAMANATSVGPYNAILGSSVASKHLSHASPNMGADNGADPPNLPFKIFVGYDHREDIAYRVCCHSILKRASIPVQIHPIKQSELRANGVYWRERGATESTDFSFTRFLTPFLAGFHGWAMFIDCDFLYTADVKELTQLIDDRYAT